LSYGFYFIADILGYWRVHGQNYSLTTITDPAALKAKLADISVLIAGNELFPSGYKTLFERRTRFGAARAVLGMNTPPTTKAAWIAVLLESGANETMLLRRMLRFGRLGQFAALAFITLRTRPMSLTRLLGQIGVRRTIIATTPAYRAP